MRPPMADDITRRLSAQIVVHDKLVDTMLVYWLAGMTEEMGEEFLAEYSQTAMPEDREAHEAWLNKVRDKAARMRSTRLHLQPGQSS